MMTTPQHPPRPNNNSRNRLIQAFRRLEAIRDKNESKHRLSRIDTEVLMIQGVSQYLGCSVAKARQIPRGELPCRKGPGRVLLFLKEDVIRYLKRGERPRRGISSEMVRDAEAAMLGSKSDSGRRRSRKETDK